MFTLMFGLTAYVMSGAVALAGTAAAVGTTAVIAGASKVAKNAHDKEFLSTGSECDSKDCLGGECVEAKSWEVGVADVRLLHGFP